jgi:hypothetical protein
MDDSTGRFWQWECKKSRLIKLLLEYHHIDATAALGSERRDKSTLFVRKVHCGAKKCPIVSGSQSKHNLEIGILNGLGHYFRRYLFHDDQALAEGSNFCKHINEKRNRFPLRTCPSRLAPPVSRRICQNAMRFLDDDHVP